MRGEERRVRKMQEEGRLTKREGDEIVAALDTLENRSLAAKRRAARFRRDLSSLGLLKARFLAGEITRARFRRGLKVLAFTSGAVTMAISTAFLFVLEHFELSGASIHQTPGGILAFALTMGVITGATMYHSQLQPMALRLAILRRKVDIAGPQLGGRRAGRCPSCGSGRQQTRFFRGLQAALWTIVPWVAINELYFGQRLPRGYQHCLACQAVYVECRRCEASVENLDWVVREPFREPRKMRCTSCQAGIACWRNVFALAVEGPVRGLKKLFASHSRTREEAR